MNSQYSIINTILNQINSQASTAQNDDIRSIIRNIANKYGQFACGSSRAVIVLPDDGIVIKVVTNNIVKYIIRHNSVW